MPCKCALYTSTIKTMLSVIQILPVQINSLQIWLKEIVIFLGTLSDLHYTHKYHMNTHVFKQYLLCMFIAFCTRSVFVGIFLKDDK